MCNINPGYRRVKRDVYGPSKSGEGGILLLKAKVYSCKSRARGVYNIYLFFLY
jgi:hypothetical protein